VFTFTIGQTDGLPQSIINMVLAVAEDAANYWGRYLNFGAATLDITINFVPLGDTTLAQAGPTFFFERTGPGGVDVFQAGPILELQDGIDPNGSTVDIDIDVNSDTIRANEFFLGGLSNPNVPFNQFDLFTVLLHEIGHGLGILAFEEGPGGDVSVYELFVDTVMSQLVFTGPNAAAVFGGNVPLDGDGSHIGATFTDVMNAALANGERLFLSPIDIAVLQDAEAPVRTPTNGADVLFGFESFSIFGADSVSLLGGDDIYDGLSGNDTVDGGSGNDTIIGGAGADSLDGGADFDTVDYQASASPVNVNLTTGSGSGGHAAGDTYANIEAVIGTGGADTITGGVGVDSLVGGFGNDTLDGSVGDDTLSGENGFDSLLGGDGDDVLMGDGGNDRLNGGNDNDTVSGGSGFDRLEGAGGNDLVQGDGGNDTLRGAGGSDTLEGGAGVDVIFGGSGADMADGGTGNDRIRPEAGNDTVTGGIGDDRAFGSFGFDLLMGDDGDDFLDGNGGNDTLEGGADNDTLIGNFGFDSLDGGTGDDRLQGSTGNDTVTGGTGDDTFVFSLGDDNDRYVDFTAGAGTDDVIELSGFGAAFDEFSEVFSAASQQGAHVVIDFGAGDTITLLNTTLASLHEDDFVFA
jgi:Ca2+-binding RTX toxin-like protein